MDAGMRQAGEIVDAEKGSGGVSRPGHDEMERHLRVFDLPILHAPRKKHLSEMH